MGNRERQWIWTVRTPPCTVQSVTCSLTAVVGSSMHFVYHGLQSHKPYIHGKSVGPNDLELAPKLHHVQLVTKQFKVRQQAVDAGSGVRSEVSRLLRWCPISPPSML